MLIRGNSMRIKERVSVISLFVCYIFTNLLFYNVIYRDYVNRNIFFITGFLFITEMAFWIFIFSLIRREERLKSSNINPILIPFLIGVGGTGVGRVLLNSSLYLNDLLTVSTPFIYFIGIIRILFIFSAFSFFFLALDTRNILLTVISCLNIVVSILIWLDFDTNISSAVRILMGLLGILYIVLLKERTIYQEEKNEKNSV